MSESGSADYQDGFNTANDRADERIRELEAEIARLNTELAIAQGTNGGLEDWVKGHRIRGRAKPCVDIVIPTRASQTDAKEPVWVGLYRDLSKRTSED